MRYAFKPSNEPGRRVTGAEVLGKDGSFRPLDKKAAYRVVALDFLARGGDGFSMFTPLRWEEGAMLGNDALKIYFERESPVKAALQGRITIR
jgi:5'-nucleotidase